MKEQFINSVIQQMLKLLDNQQLTTLKTAMESALANCDIVVNNSLNVSSTQCQQWVYAFLSAKKVEGCSPKTLAYYEATITKMLAKVDKHASKIVTDDLRKYLTEQQQAKNLSKSTVDNVRRVLSSFFAWLEDEDYIVKSPVRRIHKVKTSINVKETYTDEELELMRDSCTELRDLAIIDVLASTGMRIGEMVLLNRDDIDFGERECVVLGKGDKERVVYFDARAKKHLQDYLDSRKDENEALFVSIRKPHQRISINGIEARLRKLGKAWGIHKLHPHKFRRTLATMAIDKGMPIEQLQRLLGHKRIDTTLQYAMVKQTNVKIAHKKYIG